MTVTETLANRSCKYGTIESNSKITQELMRVLIKGENYGQLTDTHIECLHMIFHKISRMVNGDTTIIQKYRSIIWKLNMYS